ncbi:hypothetical protein OSB04_un000450 [Centaurea solstitialis]|uniref:Jacalin-type lectin domain-containing protein n=1 Tax=Centaurea solstitialis TaxID=347529 RepID=A0AA38SCK0_9ASTR|nr:hypothetical protein OSB04_un000450 [Centaurea solstitialis]
MKSLRKNLHCGCSKVLIRTFVGDALMKHIYLILQICIDYPNEYLTSISGTFENFNGFVLLTSLCFDTNQMRFGPYGLKSGTPFSYNGTGGVIVGFHGRVDPNGLSAVGIYVMPESLALCQNSTSEQSSMDDQLCASCISRMVPTRDAGPWGALGGKRWDDGVFSTVKQVHVYMDESLKVLHAIQFLYVKRDAKFFMSPMHQGTCENNMELVAVVNLDGLDEYLTGISGFYGPAEGYHGSEAITSITFRTNKKVHGPYGEERGPGHTYFTSSACPGKVVGFQGRNDEFGTESNSEGRITLGPWGGPNGKAWIWMPKGMIKKITIIHDGFIEAIKFQSDDSKTETPFFGFHWKKSKEDTICIDYPNEYFVSISGTYGKHYSSLRVQSLCFVTNKKRYGPYGLDTSSGTPFSYDGKGGVIVGFHGRADYFLYAIGIYFMRGSLAFCRNSTINEKSTHENFFNSGVLIMEAFEEICIDYPNEYFVSVSGTYVKHYTFLRVQSLCFVTNKKHYGPYGLDTSGTPFSVDGKGGVIVGFHGRASIYLNAIGIYVMPESLAFGPNSTIDEKSTHELCSRCKSRMAMPKEMGPFGAFAGKYWDDGVFSTVKRIHVFMDESLKVLRGIQILYVKRDSKLILSSMHGGTSKDKLEQAALVNLDGTDEYLTRISRLYGPVDGFNGMEAITSITFHTNKAKYGPYGEQSGDGYFTSAQSHGKVVGFHGRESNGFLTAIGVHMEYI